MSKHPNPNRKDHEKFVEVEGWKRLPTQHHPTYTLTLPNGDVYRTRISKPVDKTDYRPSMWSHILKDQLHVTEDEFWECVEDGVAPTRFEPEPQRPGLPGHLMLELVERLGMDSSKAATLTEEQAVQRIAEYWNDFARKQGH